MSDARIHLLLEKYRDGSLSDAEAAELSAALDASEPLAREAAQDISIAALLRSRNPGDDERLIATVLAGLRTDAERTKQAESIIERLPGSVERPERTKGHARPPSRQRSRARLARGRFSMGALAAAIALIAGVTYAILSTRSAPTSNVAVEGKPIGRVIHVADGAAEVETLVRKSDGVRLPLREGAELFAGDRIETGGESSGAPVARAAITLGIATTIDISDGSALDLDSASEVALQRGRAYVSVESSAKKTPGYKLQLKTPAATVGVTGTRFELIVEAQFTRVTMEEGAVDFFNALGTRRVTVQQGCSARQGEAPSAPEAATLTFTGRAPAPAAASSKERVPITFRFGPENSPVRKPDRLDTGKDFDPRRGFGWRGPTPRDSRIRNAKDFTRGSHISSGSADTVAIWELTLPRGRYRVAVTCGDYEFPQGPHHIRIEGIQVLDKTSTQMGEFIEKETVVAVDDGALTVEIGGFNTPERSIDGTSDTTLNRIVITPVE